MPNFEKSSYPKTLTLKPVHGGKIAVDEMPWLPYGTPRVGATVATKLKQPESVWRSLP
ncbi:MAG: hypothetical protein JEZ11_19035 [Desulfobacterales bacterium]|nr:hypothetical protein [Desulfobacterales bacterium]